MRRRIQYRVQHTARWRWLRVATTTSRSLRRRREVALGSRGHRPDRRRPAPSWLAQPGPAWSSPAADPPFNYGRQQHHRRHDTRTDQSDLWFRRKQAAMIGRRAVRGVLWFFPLLQSPMQHAATLNCRRVLVPHKVDRRVWALACADHCELRDHIAVISELCRWHRLALFLFFYLFTLYLLYSIWDKRLPVA